VPVMTYRHANRTMFLKRCQRVVPLLLKIMGLLPTNLEGLMAIEDLIPLSDSGNPNGVAGDLRFVVFIFNVLL